MWKLSTRVSALLSFVAIFLFPLGNPNRSLAVPMSVDKKGIPLKSGETPGPFYLPGGAEIGFFCRKAATTITNIMRVRILGESSRC